MSRRSFLQGQITETDRLLRLAGDHPLMSPGLRSRLDEMRAELVALPADGPPQPEAFLYFTGEPVIGSYGIEAEFAAKVLDPFSRMVRAQYSALKHGVVGSRGPRRDEADARMILTGLPRGSFGFELKPAGDPSPETTASITEALALVSSLIRSSAGEEERFAEIVQDASPRTLVALRDMLRTMRDRRAGFRFITGGNEVALGGEAIGRAYDRVSSTVHTAHDFEADGVPRGLMLESWRFDFRLGDGSVLTGMIGSDVEEVAAARMLVFTDRPARALLRRTTVRHKSGRVSETYELLDLVPAEPVQQYGAVGANPA